MILPSFLCPITSDVMIDPVIISATGQTFERSAIERWLSTNDTCPLTRTQLHGNHNLVENFALKNSIHEWKAAVEAELRVAKHEVNYTDITKQEQITSSRTKDIFKGLFLGKPVAVVEMKHQGVLSSSEADILAKIGKHPRIVQFIARSTTPDGRGVMVFELAPSGRNLHDLLSSIDESGRKLSEVVVVTILSQMLKEWRRFIIMA